MDIHPTGPPTGLPTGLPTGGADRPACATLLQAVTAALPAMRQRAVALDRDAAFPAQDFAELRALGLLAAPLPTALGGLGLGTEPAGADGLRRLLILLGRGNMAVGRLFEAHVNAIALIAGTGRPAQLARAAADAHGGHLFALWVTGPAEGLILSDGHLHGSRQFCSAAGQATRAVLTVAGAPAPQMLLADVTAARAEPLPIPPQGMRAAANGIMRFDAVALAPDSLLGAPGDYMREPGFSAGAWRTAAVIAGGLQALVEETRDQLAARGRAADPHQLARIGTALIAQETAGLWCQKAAFLAEAARLPPADISAYVHLARTAVETACLDTIPLVQRCLGLPAFLPPNPVERLMRDLQTYLRQPAGDEILGEAAARFIRRDLPA